MPRTHQPYAYICARCHHPASAHRLISGSPIEGPYLCYLGTCECQTAQSDCRTGLSKAAFEQHWPDYPSQLREIVA